VPGVRAARVNLGLLREFSQGLEHAPSVSMAVDAGALLRPKTTAKVADIMEDASAPAAKE